MAEKTPMEEQLIIAGDEAPIHWDEAAKRLAESRTFWMATVRPDNRPHIRPILAVWVDDALHYVSSFSARKSDNLRHNPRCTVSTGSPGLDLVVEGEAVRVTDDARLRRVAEAYESKYEWPVEIRDGAFFAEGAPTAGPPPFHIFEVRPATVYGFGTDEEYANRSTRWRFG